MTSRQANKGNNFERELAAFMGDVLQMEIRRAPLSGGGMISGLAGGADLLGTPGVHIEAKRVERLDFPGALRQAEASLLKTEAPEFPVVINRRNRQHVEDSYVLLRLKHFMPLYAAWLEQRP